VNTAIFFITYLNNKNIRLESLTSDKRSSLLGPLISYEDNEVLWIKANNLDCYNTLLGLKDLPGKNDLAYWAYL
jgi:hypothetical protein